MSIHVHGTNGAVVVELAGSAGASMLQPLVVDVLATARGEQLRIAASHAGTIASLAEARVHHLVAVHRTLADAVAPEHQPARE